MSKIKPIVSRRSTLLAGIGTILAVVALSTVVIALSTRYWLVITVNRDAIKLIAADEGANGTNLLIALQNDQLYYTRYRGLFYTCYAVTNETFMPSSMSNEQLCLQELGYNVDAYPKSAAYTTRANLMRAVVVALSMSIVASFIVVSIGFIICCNDNSILIKVGGSLSLTASNLSGAAVAMWQYCRTLEQTGINFYPFEMLIDHDPNYEVLVANSQISYSYSYISCILSAAFSVLSALFFLAAGCVSSRKQKQDDKQALYQDSSSHWPPQPVSNTTQTLVSRKPMATIPCEWHFDNNYDWTTMEPHKTYFQTQDM